MATKPSIADILSLSVPERLQLLEEIWESVAAVPESVELTDAQRRELEARLAAYRRDPSAGAPWEVVKARVARRP